MNLPPKLDPMNIGHLVNELNHRCADLVTEEFLKCIDTKRLDELKLRIRDETTALLTEIISDWNELKRSTKRDDVMNPEATIPTTEMMAQQLQGIFTAPKLTSNKEVDRESLITWHANRLAWIIGIWLQLQWKFSSDLMPASAHATNSPNGPKEESDHPLPPWDFDCLYREWHSIYVCTAEYFEIKSALLNSISDSEPLVRISIDNGDHMNDAAKSFYLGEDHSPLLIERALRSSLIDLLCLREATPPLDLAPIPTHVLVILAHKAGVAFSFPLIVIGNITTDLERHSALCQRPPLSFLYPAFRIIEATVGHIRGLKATSSMTASAHQMIRNILKSGHP